MPCLEITMPKVDLSTKSALAAQLTKAFDEATGFGADILGVVFREYGPGEAAQGGKLWDGTGAPFLHILIYCPRIRRGAKQKVAEGLTQAFVSCLGKPDWLPVIHIAEHPYDNVVVGGHLLSDMDPECAKLDFYYPMADRARLVPSGGIPASPIIHITTASQWDGALREGTYCGDTLATEGFIHCSTPRQVVRVANYLFIGKTDLVLLVIDPDKVQPDMRHENLEGGEELFPHIYGPLSTAAVARVLDFQVDDSGEFCLPIELEALACVGVAR